MTLHSLVLCALTVNGLMLPQVSITLNMICERLRNRMICSTWNSSPLSRMMSPGVSCVVVLISIMVQAYTVFMWQTILAINLFNGDRFRLNGSSKTLTCNGEPSVKSDRILVFTKQGIMKQLAKDATVQVWYVEGK